MSNKSCWIHCAECRRNQLHKAHGLCHRCYQCQWRENNPKRKAEYDRQWRKAHKKHIAEYNCQYNMANFQKVADLSRRWKKAHPQKVASGMRRWRKAHRDLVRAAQRRKRARKRNATVEHVDERFIYNRDRHACVYCGDTRDLTLDHVVALAQGEVHGYDNLVVACRSCNSSKGVKDVGEWLRVKNLSPFSLY